MILRNLSLKTILWRTEKPCTTFIIIRKFCIQKYLHHLYNANIFYIDKTVNNKSNDLYKYRIVRHFDIQV